MNTSNKLNENKESQEKKPWKIKERIENIQTKARKGVTAALIGLSISWGFSSCENKGKEDPYKLEINEVPKALIGKKISGLYSHYAGGNWETITLWKTQNLDKNKILQDLYGIKFSRENMRKYVVAKQHYDNVVSKINFNDYTPITLPEYEEQIDQTLNKIKNNIDRDGLWKKLLWGDKEKLKTLQDLSDNISPQSLTSYSMTELFPGTDGNFNKNFLNFLLQNGGTQYLEYLPAIYDDYTSFWQYQLTSLAVRETDKGKEGASKVNEFVQKDLRIPWSVSLLQGEDHHKAAYLLSINNLSNLLRNWDSTIQNALKKLTKIENQANLAQLIAIMHNKPINWKKFLEEREKLNTNKTYLEKKQNWKNGKYNYDTNQNGQIDIYESFVGNENDIEWSHNYWEKTYNNFKALSE